MTDADVAGVIAFADVKAAFARCMSSSITTPFQYFTGAVATLIRAGRLDSAGFSQASL